MECCNNSNKQMIEDLNETIKILCERISLQEEITQVMENRIIEMMKLQNDSLRRENQLLKQFTKED